MRRVRALLSVLCTTAFVAGCTNGVATLGPGPARPPATVRYRVEVDAFEDRVFRNEDIGRGMADMLADALIKTDRFIVLKRSVGNGAQFVIDGAVTAFDPSCTGSPLIIVSPGQGCVSLDIRVVDAASGRVVDTATVDGTSTGDSPDLSLATGVLPAGLGDYGGTPAEAAIRSCVEAAAKRIAAQLKSTGT
jgi:curli biogenesis system outer membrane secretion channel CsgG